MKSAWSVGLVGIALLAFANRSFGQGAYVSTAGPVNRGMGGASTAAPIDALGALYWNPATISGLKQSELAFGMDLLLAKHKVSSTIGPLSGSTNAEPGVFPIPNAALVYHVPDSAYTLGVGMNSVAGFKTNLPSDPRNPVLAPQPYGLGRVSSEASFFEITPVLSAALTEKLSIALGPVIAMGQVGVEPFVLNAPNANGIYSPGRSSRYHWGGGVQAGVYYVCNCDWRLGASIKSPMWMERFRFFGQTATGAPRTLHANIDLPMIVSLGTAYTGWEDWLIALDLRYFDYADTQGFGDRAVYNAAGALQGLDWSSVMSASLGVQRQVSEKLALRAGYTYNQNPIKNSESFFNIASVLIYQHMLSAGATWNVSDRLAVNMAYSYMPQISRTGPVVLPVGAIPGSSVTNTLSTHFLSLGVAARF